MKNQRLIALFITMLVATMQASAQPAMADALREDGKIYVVVGVVVLMFVVLFAYLVSIDLKLKKVEKENNKR